jgi:glycosyltransferase involved in cell wall biosynthesis
MKFSVVINNFNYGRYVVEAIASAQAQAHAPHEIIVVDDGSTDDSCDRIGAAQKDIGNLRLHRQPNSGQLCAVRKGIELATGDWCFFLDADDTWTPEHLAEAARIIGTHADISLYYTDHRETSGPPLFHSKWPPGEFGRVLGLVAVTRARVGSITSTLGLRRDLASLALDFDRRLDADWRTRADDCLLYGASFAGAIAYYHPVPTVRYRIHGANAYARTDRDLATRLNNTNRTRLFEVLSARFGVRRDALLDLLWSEFSGSPRNQRHAVLRHRYRRAIRRAPGGPLRKLTLWLCSFWYG